MCSPVIYMPPRIKDLHLLVRMIILNIVYFQDLVMHFRTIWHLPEPQPNLSVILHDTCSVLHELFNLTKLSCLLSPQEP